MYGRQGGNVKWGDGVVVERDKPDDLPNDLQCEAMNELDVLLGF